VARFGVELVALDAGSVVGDVVIILLICGVLALVVRWGKGRQRRLLESADLHEDKDEARLLIEPEREEAGVGMPHLYAVGMNGQIEVDDEYVRIHRKGVLGHAGRGLVGLLGRGAQIHLFDIQDIEISYPRLTKRGWIRFLTGGEERMTPVEAIKDQATVLFTGRQQEAIDQLRQQVKALIASQSNDAMVEAIANRVAAAPRASLATEIRELAALRDEGLLTEEEFQARKAQLLADR
jgi:hypothetical protein